VIMYLTVFLLNKTRPPLAELSCGVTHAICSPDIDTGFASLLILLTAVDAGPGHASSASPWNGSLSTASRSGSPATFMPIGGISVGYSDEPPRNFSHLRKPTADTVHKGRWGQPA